MWFQVYAAEQAEKQAALAAQQAALAAQFAELHRKVDNGFYNNIAIAHNMNCMHPERNIRPLRNHSGDLPPNFPEKKRDLFALSSSECIAILNFYNLPNDGPVSERRKRLADHIGFIE